MPDGSSAIGTLTPGSGGLTPPAYPPDHPLSGTIITPTPVLSAADTQAAQMRHLVASAHAEKEHLSVQIKEARRASQRAEAALRQEIESVKRAIDKAGSLDMRARQKTLALQEQVKQGWAGAEGAEESAQSVEGGMAELEAQLHAVTLELQAVKEELDGVREREEEIRERDRRSRAEEEKRLAEVQARLDKQRKVKEKKAGEKADLEKRLESVQREQEETEKRFDEMRKRASLQAQHQGQAQGQGPYGGYANQGHHGMAWDPWEAHAHAHAQHAGTHRLANHPSMPNIGAGAAFRPRGSAYQPRFASGGSRPAVNVTTANAVQAGPAQASPTHPAGFTSGPAYPVRPVPGASTAAAAKASTSPALANRLPPGAAQVATSSSNVGSGTGSTASPANLQSNLPLPGVSGIVPSGSPAVGGSSSGGTNPSAAPFMPSTASPSLGNVSGPTASAPGRTASPALGSSSPSIPATSTSPGISTKGGAEYVYDPSHHTTLMPQSLQHRIYFSSTHAQGQGSASSGSGTSAQSQQQQQQQAQAVRPRPTPNFHPPPSVLAEQAQRAQDSGVSAGTSGTGIARKGSLSSSTAMTTGGQGSTPPLPGSPSFPPLPSHSASTTRSGSGDDSASGSGIASTFAGTAAAGHTSGTVRSTSPLSAPSASTSPAPSAAQHQQGPSLASIITRAVLQPGSGVLNNTSSPNTAQGQAGRRTASPPYGIHASAYNQPHPQYGQAQDGRPGIMSRRSSATIAPTSSAFGAAASHAHGQNHAHHLDAQIAQHANASLAIPSASGGGSSGMGKVSFGPSPIQNAILARGSSVLNQNPNQAPHSRPATTNNMGSTRAGSGSGSGDAEFPPLSPLGGQGQAQGQAQGQGPSVGPWSALNLGGLGGQQ